MKYLLNVPLGLTALWHARFAYLVLSAKEAGTRRALLV